MNASLKSFTRENPDENLNCVLDFNAEHVGSKMNAKSYELHRRPQFGVSFVAASVRALVKMLRPLPPNLSKALFADDKNPIVLNLCNVRTMLQTQQGRDFVVACDFLDNGNAVTRNSAAAPKPEEVLHVHRADRPIPASC